VISFDNEKSLEDFICNSFHKTGKFICDQYDYDYLFRQVTLGSYGISDLIFVRIEYDEEDDIEEIFVNVVELKNEKIKTKDIAQVARYRFALDKCLNMCIKEQCFNVKSSLVVKDGVCENEDACYLINQIKNLKVYEFSLCDETGNLLFDHCENFYNVGAVHHEIGMKVINLIKDKMNE